MCLLGAGRGPALVLVLDEQSGRTHGFSGRLDWPGVGTSIGVFSTWQTCLKLSISLGEFSYEFLGEPVSTWVSHLSLDIGEYISVIAGLL